MTDEELIEELAGAHRTSADDVRFHPAFYDLDEAGRLEAHRRALVLRQLEAAVDPDGRSTTVHAVLARIRDAGG